jgi:hypothetical protein
VIPSIICINSIKLLRFFSVYSSEMSNGTSYIDDIITPQNSDTILIKLQADSDGRYGFNVKVIY